MLALSPPLFSTTCGWPLEDLITQNLQQDYDDISIAVEANAYHSLIHIPTFDQTRYDFVPSNSVSYGGDLHGDITNPKKVAKKLNHNASERDRRKRVNEVYALLCSLLPISSDQKKKVSIPGIVSHALKYIPQLQKEVETLMHKKEKLLQHSSSPTNVTMQQHIDITNHSDKESTSQTTSSVVSSVSVLEEKEVVIQLISSSDHMYKNKDSGFLSKALEYLEEEHGLVLLNATIYGDNKFLSTLHLQMQGGHEIEAEKLKEKLCSFYQM